MKINLNKLNIAMAMGLIRYMKLGTTKIPIKELNRFIDESIGQDIDSLIKEKKKAST